LMMLLMLENCYRFVIQINAASACRYVTLIS
jgi:hypothetical protein